MKNKPIAGVNEISESKVLSPCIRHCCLDGDDVCVGCYRTITEIMNWQPSSDAQKRDILNRCSTRKQQHDARYR